MSDMPSSDGVEDQLKPLDDQWFESARVVNDDWVEFRVEVSGGDTVLYHFPRSTLFAAIDT
ncbi:hypothetical protein [Amycolatopsis vancoresmycina]|uniref:Uncharacterized protein n=1 Tax=Amycolatopsis vancoresmycina DSM 44592 TaxID=1292037 RepID=R1HJE2_9PSEU|nr:hypothetical protein [Amycolatopsis vancoresmycina]EOD63690.1 hypothetical protein H480_35713 [Amycolatopsis vancoresmycina DSM 44592]